MVTIINYNNCGSELPTGVRFGQAEVGFPLKRFEKVLWKRFKPQGLCTGPPSASCLPPPPAQLRTSLIPHTCFHFFREAFPDFSILS